MTTVGLNQPIQTAQLGREVRGAGSDAMKEAWVRGALDLGDPQKAAARIQQQMTGDKAKFSPQEARQMLTEIAGGNPNRPETRQAQQVLNILFPKK